MAEEREMTVEERVAVFMDLQQKIADAIGLAVPVQHGCDFPLYDIWEKKMMTLRIENGTEIIGHDGDVTVRYFEGRK